MHKKVMVMLFIYSCSNKQGWLGCSLFYVHYTFQSFFWELAFDGIVTADFMLNSSVDRLKAVMNHRVE